ncbi:fasciclin domain-containing protein [Kitasatospora sp. NPDC088346]|uniref:fasciclin domain-containing protein n=1 Tax=Kitasatospora sp. NPDC088346 TaxID=3364073 RepID=UPI003830E975
MFVTRIQSVATLLAAGTLALGLTACSSDSSSGYGAPAAAPAAPQAAAPAAAGAPSTAPKAAGGADAPFGAACAAVPKDGSGSFAGMAKDPVATAASHNPMLSTLVSAVTAAGLGDTLNSAQNITVFAPTNDAFAKVPADQLKALLADKDKLTKVLTYHVAPAPLAPANLAGAHKTLEGADLKVAGAGQAYTVNGNSKVLCGNVQTANATVYIVDTVLMPAS